MNGPTIFLPLNTNIGGPVKYIKGKETICLTNDQARHIYEKVKSESIVNIDTIKQEIEKDRLGRNMDEDEVNPGDEIVTNIIEKENMITMHIEQWSVLSTVFNYVQCCVFCLQL